MISSRFAVIPFPEKGKKLSVHCIKTGRSYPTCPEKSKKAEEAFSDGDGWIKTPSSRLQDRF
jgi:hypothetical protein